MPYQDSRDYHIGRLLVLLRHFAPPDKRPMQGLTKLAKLDFLLRYPSFTDRLLQARAIAWPLGAEPTQSERSAVESRMIRYKYGPWDDRYYALLGSLVGLGLAVVNSNGKSLTMQLTDKGLQYAESIASSDDWFVVDSRAGLLKKMFDTTGSKLKDMIYQELPDAVDRLHRAKI